MAAPRDLPIRPLISDQPLQTPDTSSLFLPSSSSNPSSLAPSSSTTPADAMGFTSLEELLDASGINNLDGVPSIASDHSDASQQPQSRKRVCSESVDLDNGFTVKSAHLDSGNNATSSSPSSSLSSSLSFPSSSLSLQLPSAAMSGSLMARLDGSNLLSQVPSSGMVTIPSIVASVTRGPSPVPLSRPVSVSGSHLLSMGSPHSSSTTNLQQQQHLPLPLSSTVGKKPLAFASTSSSSETVVTTPSTCLPGAGGGVAASLFSQPSAAGTVAGLVQQFKQAQASGDLSAMDRIRHKLLLLHQQLATRAVSSSLAQNSISPSTPPTSTTPPPSKTGFTPNLAGTIANKINLLPMNTLPGQPSVVPNTTQGYISGQNSIRHSTSLPATVTAPYSTSPPSATTMPIVATSQQQQQHQGKPLSGSASLIAGNPLPSIASRTTESVNKPISSSSSVQFPISTLPLFTGNGNLEGAKLHDQPATLSLSQVTSLMSALPANNVASPSIVTQMPSLNSAPIRQQQQQGGGGAAAAGLHVTAQTQANVLRAVYGYRLRQIQDFLATLPAEQRPSTTQELREMLKQNNVLSKGLPPSFLAQLQHQDNKALNLAPPPTSTTPTKFVPAPVTLGSTALSNCISNPVPPPTQSVQGLPPNPPTTITVTAATTTPSIAHMHTSISSSSPSLSASCGLSRSTPSIVALSSANGTRSSSNLSAPLPSSTITSITTTTTTTSSLGPSSSSQSTSAAAGSSSSQPPVVLPGVTMETLRTLCRLPEADVSRIPMHPMLQAVVHYLRTAKWVGNKTELPRLLQKAQEAIGKGTLVQQPPPLPARPLPMAAAAATGIPPPPSSSSEVVQTVGSLLQQISSTPPSSAVSMASSSSAPSLLGTSSVLAAKSAVANSSNSPLAQYMAKVGAKLPGATETVGSRKDHAYRPPSQMASLSAQQTNSKASPAAIRPLTRYQHRIQQEKVEQERLQALQKALQSSEEARIAFRFQAHMEKLNQQLLSPEMLRPFSSWQEVALRLIPYHVYSEPELPQGAMEKAEAVYEGIAGVLQSKAQGMMSRYQQILDQENKGDCVMRLVVDRLWLEGEKERKEEEERQRLEAEQVAQELRAMSDPLSDQLSVMSPESDPLLSNYWTPHESSDFFSGIT